MVNPHRRRTCFFSYGLNPLLGPLGGGVALVQLLNSVLADLARRISKPVQPLRWEMSQSGVEWSWAKSWNLKYKRKSGLNQRGIGSGVAADTWRTP